MTTCCSDHIESEAKCLHRARELSRQPACRGRQPSTATRHDPSSTTQCRLLDPSLAHGVPPQRVALSVAPWRAITCIPDKWPLLQALIEAGPLIDWMCRPRCLDHNVPTSEPTANTAALEVPAPEPQPLAPIQHSWTAHRQEAPATAAESHTRAHNPHSWAGQLEVPTTVITRTHQL